MNLKDFLEFIADHAEEYGDFRVTAGPWPFDDEKLEPTLDVEIVDIYADDTAQDIIFLLPSEDNSPPVMKVPSLKELEGKLLSLSDGRLDYSVEFGQELPDDWRYDMPFYGSATDDNKRIYALCWKSENQKAVSHRPLLSRLFGLFGFPGK
jgi:hypothetical protein